ncbi:hypothetical protein SLE2022_125190 [Rubroshorea leprosula]
MYDATNYKGHVPVHIESRLHVDKRVQVFLAIKSVSFFLLHSRLLLDSVFSNTMAEKLGSAFLTGLFFLILTFTHGNEALEQKLDSGRPLPLVFTGEKGRTYKCLQTSTNFRIQGHNITLIKVGAAHTMREVYESLDVRDLGRSITVFVTLHAHQPTEVFFIVASSHFTNPVLTATAILDYLGSKIPPFKPLPIGPNWHIHWSIKRARTIRLNATPNPQGSFHYRTIPTVRILFLKNTPTETKPPCTYKKFPAETEPFTAETKPCSHVVDVLPRNRRRLLGKRPDVKVHSPSSTSHETSWNLDKEDPPSPPPPSGNPYIHE